LEEDVEVVEVVEPRWATPLVAGLPPQPAASSDKAIAAAAGAIARVICP
jgi:hypothetical protein